MSKNSKDILYRLDKLLEDRKKASPDDSYVSSLYEKGNDYINSKVLEEAGEFVEAINEYNKKNIIHEAADLWFHTLVSLSLNEVSSNDILEELENRFGLSGLEEKRLRNK